MELRAFLLVLHLLSTLLMVSLFYILVVVAERGALHSDFTKALR